jgi:ubiquitin carboxyl-terminal hydrolase 16/45
VLVDAVKRLLLLAPPPPVLVVHLKRFCGSARTHKVGGHVAFPEVLDIAPYSARAAADDAAGAGAGALPALLFRLCAVVVHSGTMSGGHYIAYVRHGAPAPFRHGKAGVLLQPSCGEAWALASDKSVQPATLADVLAAEAYLIVYERVVASDALQ